MNYLPKNQNKYFTTEKKKDDCEEECKEINGLTPLTPLTLERSFLRCNQSGLKNITKLEASYEKQPCFDPKDNRISKKIDKKIHLKTSLFNEQALRYNSGFKQLETSPQLLTAVEEQALNCEIMPAIINNKIIGAYNEDSGFKGLVGLSLYNKI